MSNVLVSEISGLKVYNLSKGRTLQEMLKNANFNLRILKKDSEYYNRVELIQDFEFPVSSSCIKLSEDGSHMFAAGVYAPKLKIYDLNELSLKVERGVDAEVRRIAPISDDFTKCALLLEDRNIEIHAQYGKHFSIRIPKFGRDMVYNSHSCELLSCGTGNEIYRLNLCEGSFMKQIETEISGINAVRYNSFLNIVGVCGELGKVELHDLKSMTKVGSLPLLENSLFSKFDISEATCLEFNNFQLAVGNAVGCTSVYDLRYQAPLFTIKHNYKFPIKSVKFHEFSGNIITVDKKLIKFSNSKTGATFTNIEANSDINDFECYQGSGMFFTANESTKMDAFYVPGIGPAPKWCSFLEKITEELEDGTNYNLSEDKKFLTPKELEEISSSNLIGTKFLTPYMHGYFMDMKMYKKLKTLTEPFNYEKYVEDQKNQKVNKMLENRIVIKPKSENSKHVGENDSGARFDSRFASKLSSEDFKIDTSSAAFKRQKEKEKKSLIKGNEKIRSLVENEYERKNRDEQMKRLFNPEEDEKDDKEDRIVNKEILKLNEQLIKKKKQKSPFFNNSSKYDNYEERLNELVTEDLDTIELKIKKELKKSSKSEGVSNKERKKMQEQEKLEGRRLLNNKRKYK